MSACNAATTRAIGDLQPGDAESVTWEFDARATVHDNGVDLLGPLRAATRSGLIVERLGLTDAKGHPGCARLSGIAWSADQAE